MDIEKYKCVSCKNIPGGDVYRCYNQHYMCEKCTTKKGMLCTCFEKLTTRENNPIMEHLQQVQRNTIRSCIYIESGCTWKFNANEMESHVKECKYRPYKCIGTILGVWSCNWQGIQMNLEQHIQKDHTNLGSEFSYYQIASVPFDENNTIGTLNLIDAFSKKFIFYFYSNHQTKMVYFVIFYLGRQEEANQYMYEFEVKSPKAEFREIKFIEHCVNDSNKISDIIEAGNCVILPQNVVKSHLFENSIHFRFIVKRKLNEELPEKMRNLSVEDTKSKSRVKAKNALKNSIEIPKKKSMKDNKKKETKKGPSSPTLSSSITPKTNTSPPPFNFTVLDYSSINKTLSPNVIGSPISTEPPCLKPSINKTPEIEDKLNRDLRAAEDPRRAMNSARLQDPRTGPNLQYSNVQQYKEKVEKGIIQMYPSNSLHKPTFKR